MASKLRRTPLFGYDGNLGIPILPSSGTKPKSSNSNGSYSYQATTMDVGVTTRYSNEPATNSKPSQNNRHAHKAHPSTPNKQVNFQTNSDEKKREKFLTAKYGAHQMALIRKRLRVEMWMYERLQELYGAEDIEIDLDEVLDMDSEMERQQYIRNLLREPQGASENINIFVGDLLEKVKTL